MLRRLTDPSFTAVERRSPSGAGHARLPGGRRLPLVWILGLGAFGLAFSISTTAAYLPPLLSRFTDSRTLIASIVAAEGAFALTVPLVIGPWSDTFLTPMGRRRPFMLAALPALGFCLALVAFMPTIWTVGLVIAAFYAAYYIYEPPYRGLYPDLLDQSLYGRSQSVQHILRGAAIGIALVGGGFLLKLWRPGPFLFAAVVTTAACGAVVLFVQERGGHDRVYRGLRAYVATSWQIFRREPDVRMFLAANAAWEGTFAAMRTWVVLYITKGLDQPLSTSSWVLFTVAAGYIVAALIAGPIGDRIGLARTILYASCVYGVGLLFAGLANSWHSWYYGVIFPVAIAGGVVMTLSWALLFKLMPAQHRGAISGIATTTKGWGLLLGPLIAGAAIDLFGPYLEKTDGYQALWPVCALPVLLAIPIVASLIRVEPRGQAPDPEPELG
jgi:MFS family permease